MLSKALADVAFAMWPVLAAAIGGYVVFRVCRFIYRNNKRLSSFRRI